MCLFLFSRQREGKRERRGCVFPILLVSHCQLSGPTWLLQDAFIALHLGWWGFTVSCKALACSECCRERSPLIPKSLFSLPPLFAGQERSLRAQCEKRWISPLSVVCVCLLDWTHCGWVFVWMRLTAWRFKGPWPDGEERQEAGILCKVKRLSYVCHSHLISVFCMHDLYVVYPGRYMESVIASWMTAADQFWIHDQFHSVQVNRVTKNHLST